MECSTFEWFLRLRIFDSRSPLFCFDCVPEPANVLMGRAPTEQREESFKVSSDLLLLSKDKS